MPLTRTEARASGPARPAGPRRPRRAAARALALAAGAAAAAAAAACGGRDPFAPNPENNADTRLGDIVVYALSRAAGPRPTAVDLFTLQPLRPVLVSSNNGAVTAFDFAVDLAPDGRVRLLPSRLVADAGSAGRVRRTGFQTTATPFDSVAEAPERGYQSDSVTVVNVGQTAVVQFESLNCNGGLLYAKVLVVTADPASGGVTLRARVNPNCGYRSLRPGRG